MRKVLPAFKFEFQIICPIFIFLKIDSPINNSFRNTFHKTDLAETLMKDNRIRQETLIDKSNFSLAESELPTSLASLPVTKCETTLA